MAVESVTVVAPDVTVGPFHLSKGNCQNNSCFTVCHIVSIQLIIHQLIVWSSSGLVEQINNFQTLSLRHIAALNFDPFLTIDDDYFYHTQNPRRPEVSIMMGTSPKYMKCCPVLCYIVDTVALSDFSYYLFGL